MAWIKNFLKSHLRTRPAEDALSYFQNRLVILLYGKTKPSHIKDILMADPKLKSFHAYIRDMEEPMLAIASELVHKWGRVS